MRTLLHKIIYTAANSMLAIFVITPENKTAPTTKIPCIVSFSHYRQARSRLISRRLHFHCARPSLQKRPTPFSNTMASGLTSHHFTSSLHWTPRTRRENNSMADDFAFDAGKSRDIARQKADFWPGAFAGTARNGNKKILYVYRNTTRRRCFKTRGTSAIHAAKGQIYMLLYIT